MGVAGSNPATPTKIPNGPQGLTRPHQSPQEHRERRWHAYGTRRGSALASIRKRAGKWHVQIRRKGRAAVTRSFLLKGDADTWARQQELEADRQGLPTAHKAMKGLTVADVLTRYRDEVVPRKRGAGEL